GGTVDPYPETCAPQVIVADNSPRRPGLDEYPRIHPGQVAAPVADTAVLNNNAGSGDGQSVALSTRLQHGASLALQVQGLVNNELPRIVPGRHYPAVVTRSLQGKSGDWPGRQAGTEQQQQ